MTITAARGAAGAADGSGIWRKFRRRFLAQKSGLGRAVAARAQEFASNSGCDFRAGNRLVGGEAATGASAGGGPSAPRAFRAPPRIFAPH